MVDHELNEESMTTPLNKSVTTDSFEENENHAEPFFVSDVSFLFRHARVTL